MNFEIKLSDFFDNTSIKWLKGLNLDIPEVELLYSEDFELGEFKKSDLRMGKFLSNILSLYFINNSNF